jgi:acetyltransferase
MIILITYTKIVRLTISLSHLYNNKNNDNTYISGEQATSILNAYGFKTPTTKLATNEDECMRFSDYIGYPVALKISSPHIVHKTDVGGVELNLRNS